MPSITDALRARGIGSGQGISQTDLTALIDVTNAAEANNDAIKTDVVNKLNALNPALNLTTAASWSTIRAAIASMQYRGAQTITPGPGDIPIPAGYHNGGGKVSGVSVPVANVLAGTTIAGQTGTMTNRGAVAITPGPADQSIPAGYHNGAGVVKGVTVPVAKLVEGNTVAGQAGTLKDYSLTKLVSSGANYAVPKSVKAPNNGYLYIEPQTGYYTEGLNAGGYGSVRLQELNLVSSNILSGKSIFGVAGTAQPQKSVLLSTNELSTTGTSYTHLVGSTITNLATANWRGSIDFDPTLLVLYKSGNTQSDIFPTVLIKFSNVGADDWTRWSLVVGGMYGIKFNGNAYVTRTEIQLPVYTSGTYYSIYAAIW